MKRYKFFHETGLAGSRDNPGYDRWSESKHTRYAVCSRPDKNICTRCTSTRCSLHSMHRGNIYWPGDSTEYPLAINIEFYRSAFRSLNSAATKIVVMLVCSFESTSDKFSSSCLSYAISTKVHLRPFTRCLLTLRDFLLSFQ